MSINIKEIFKSDLDPNSDNWWAKDKIDKLNFNFGQLANGGAPGPIGLEGTEGLTGVRGIQGTVGDQGSTGAEGDEGLPGLATWIINTDVDIENTTLLPNRMPSPEYSAVGIIIGKNYDEITTSQYNEPLPWNDTGSTPAVFYGNTDRSSFGLDADSGLLFGVHNYNNGVLHVGEDLEAVDVGIKMLISQSSLKDTTHSLHIGNTENQITPIPSAIEFSSSLFKVDKSTIFDSPEVNIDTLKYGLNPLLNQVIISTDDVGSVIWKSKYEVFGALPIGSIISVSKLEFNNANFHFVDTLQTDPISGLLLNIFGRGRVNTQFEGWYLCNGQTWEKDGVISYEVPNLNKFTFNIEGDGIDQDTVQGGSASNILIGGAEVTMGATYDMNSSSYTIEADLLDESSTIKIGSGQWRANNMVHLINLGEPLLDWKTAEGSEVILQDIILSEPRNYFAEACSAPTQTYQWAGDPITDWGATTLPTGTLYLNGATAPINKWYSKDGYARQWLGTAWSNATTSYDCPIAKNLVFDSSVIDLNWQGSPPVGDSYLLDTSSLSNATSIKNVSGSNAASGWYREVTQGASVWHRVFWNGTTVTFRTSENYVHYAGEHRATTAIGIQACKNMGLYVSIYYATHVPTAPTFDFLDHIYTNQYQVLVNTGWFSSDHGFYGLIPIAEQPIPSSSTTKYKTLVEDFSPPDDLIVVIGNTSAEINQSTSKLQSTDECTPTTILAFESEAVSDSIGKSDCQPGMIGTIHTYSVPAGEYTSFVSQADATQKAWDYLYDNIQQWANDEGTCLPIVDNDDDIFNPPSCFIAGSKVKVYSANGFVDINIEDVKLGDKLLGRNNVLNTVLEFDRPLLGNRKLYDINKNNDYFVSEEHPMLTKKGWKSLKPEYIQKNEKEIWKELFEGRDDVLLGVGDEMVMYDGTFTVINSLDLKVEDPYTQLYNFNLDGDNTYVVNNYVVHNT